MTTDPLDRLRAVNPVPHGSAPPVARVLARLDEPPHRTRRSGWLIPGLALAVSAGVVALVIGFAGGLHRESATRPGTTTVRTATTSPPAQSLHRIHIPGGMRGSVFVLGAFVNGGRMEIPLQQTPPRGGGQSARYWVASSVDDGHHWHVRRASTYPLQVATAGRDQWRMAAVAARNASYTVRYEVSHDAGVHWTPVRAPVSVASDDSVSVAGGETWAIGNATGTTPGWVILRGPATGDHLSPTPTSPLPATGPNVSVSAVDSTTAYVTSAGAPRGMWQTVDGGRSWRRLAAPCPPGYSGQPFPGPLWTVCSTTRGPYRTLVRRAIDGGRAWRDVWSHPHAQIERITPVSRTTAWLLTADGRVLRTIDGGSHWQTVFSSPITPLPRYADTPALAVGDADTATLVVAVSHGRSETRRRTNLVTFTTTTGSSVWGLQPVRLPPG